MVLGASEEYLLCQTLIFQRQLFFFLLILSSCKRLQLAHTCVCMCVMLTYCSSGLSIGEVPFICKHLLSDPPPPPPLPLYQDDWLFFCTVCTEYVPQLVHPWLLSLAIPGYPWLSLAIPGYPWLSLAIQSELITHISVV